MRFHVGQFFFFPHWREDKHASTMGLKHQKLFCKIFPLPNSSDNRWISVDWQCLWMWQWSHHKPVLQYWSLLQPCHQSLCSGGILLPHPPQDDDHKMSVPWQTQLWQKSEVYIHNLDPPDRSLPRLSLASSCFWILWPNWNNKQLPVQECQSWHCKLVIKLICNYPYFKEHCRYWWLYGVNFIIYLLTSPRIRQAYLRFLSDIVFQKKKVEKSNEIEKSETFWAVGMENGSGNHELS